MRIPEKEGRTKKRGKKCLLKVKEKIEEKKKDKKKGKYPKWNSLCSHDNKKENTKRNSFGRCTKQNPKKKKNCFFNTKPPRRNIYIYH